MPEYLSPGVYIEEVNSGPRPIEGVGTAVAAFVGFAPYSEAADVNKPVLITNWSQYVERFGKPDAADRREPHMAGTYLSHAVYGYFQNGGGRCYVTRVLPPAVLKKRPASLEIPTEKPGDKHALAVTADGSLPANVKLLIDRPPDAPEGAFDLRIQVGRGKPSAPEQIKLGQASPSSPPAPDNAPPDEAGAEQKVKRTSVASASAARTLLKELEVDGTKTKISIHEVSSAAALADRMPKSGAYLLEMPQEIDGIEIESREMIGEVTQRSGVQGMEIADEVTMVCFPDLMSPLVHPNSEKNEYNHTLIKSVQDAMIAHCERMHDRVAILDAPPDIVEPQKVLKWRKDTTNYNSMFATLYYPWIKVAGPDGKELEVPPCGHVAGIYARNDNTRGVHKAPANEVIRGVLDVTTRITKGEQDILNPAGINCICAFPGRGTLVWGARTLSNDPAWRYVNVRRLFNYVEKSIERSMQWVVFEPNDYDLWARVRRDIVAFLTVCWRDGMLFGRSPEEAFYVKCDEELNPAEVRDLGRLIVEIGLAPVKPAEFAIFRFSQIAGGGA
jgi:uncharacterized protein